MRSRFHARRWVPENKCDATTGGGEGLQRKGTNRHRHALHMQLVVLPHTTDARGTPGFEHGHADDSAAAAAGAAASVVLQCERGSTGGGVRISRKGGRMDLPSHHNNLRCPRPRHNELRAHNARQP